MAIRHIQPYSLNFQPFYKTQTKCKTYIGSPGVILNGQKRTIFDKSITTDPPTQKRKEKKLDGSALIFISHPFQSTYLVLVAKVRKLSSKSNMANLAVVAVVPV